MTVSGHHRGGPGTEHDEPRGAHRARTGGAGDRIHDPVTAQGRLTTPAEFADIIVRGQPGHPGAAVLSVRNLGRVVLGPAVTIALARLSGQSTASTLVYLRQRRQRATREKGGHGHG